MLAYILGITKWGSKGSTNRGRFKGLQIGRGIINKGQLKRFQIGAKNYKSEQRDFKSGKRLQIGAEHKPYFTNKDVRNDEPLFW